MRYPRSRKHLLAVNASLSLLAWAFPLLLTLVTTPLLLKYLGTGDYGLYTLILGFIGYSFTFGIGKAAGKYVAEYNAKGDGRALSEAVSAVMIASLLLGIVAVLFFTLLSPRLVSGVLLIENPEPAVAAFQLAGFVVFATILSIVFQNVLQGMQRFDRFLLLSVASNLLVAGGSIFLVLNGGGVKALIALHLAVATAVGLAYFFISSSSIPQLAFTLSIRNEIRNKVLAYSASIIAYQIFGNLVVILERVLIVRYLGTDALAFYAIPLSLALYFFGFSNSLNLAIFPVANEILENRDNSLTLYRAATKAMLAISGFFIAACFFGGDEFLGLWLGIEAVERSYLLLCFHAISISFLIISSIAWQFAETNELFHMNAVTSAVLFATAVPAMLMLVHPMGLEGVAVGRMLGSMMFLFLIVWFERKVFARFDWSFLSTTTLKILLAGLASAIAYTLLNMFFETSWPGLVFCVAVAGLVYVTTLLAIRFADPTELEAIRTPFFGRRK